MLHACMYPPQLYALSQLLFQDFQKKIRTFECLSYKASCIVATFNDPQNLFWICLIQCML